MVLNEGSVGNNQCANVGLNFKDNDIDNKGYMLIGSNGDEFEFKAPQNDKVFKIKENLNDFYDLTHKLYVDTQDSALQASINALNQAQTGLTSQIATINNNVLDNIPFSKINAFPSDNSKVLYGDGVFRNPGNISVVLDNQTLNNCYVNDPLLSDYSGRIVNTKYVKDKLDAQNKATVSQDGILRKEDFIIFNNKQDALNNASALVDGTLKKEDWVIFNNKQDVLPYVSSLVDGIVPKAKYDYWNAKIDSASLNNVNNTSDLNKPISNAVQTSLDLKQNISGMNKAAVGLSNVDNTSDLNKPISNAVQTALNTKIDSLNNKTLTDCDSNTQLTANNSTKIATTAYVKNCLSTPNTYVGSSNATSTSFTLSTSYQDIASITIPVAGTYEINLTAIGSIDAFKIVSVQLYNSTSASYVANSLIQSQFVISGRLYVPLSRSYIIENVPAGTIFIMRAKVDSGTASFIWNNETNGYSYLSYKMLGITTNVPLTKQWADKGTATASGTPFNLSFGTNNFYILNFDGTATGKCFFKSTSNINANISST